MEKVEEGPIRGTVVKFALGKLKQNGRGILYYDVKEVTEKSKLRIDHVLLYDLKAPR